MGLYETLAAGYEELFPVNPATLRFLERNLVPRDGRRALDLGSATGGHALALAAAGWSVTGLEPCGPMRELAENRVSESGLPLRFLDGGMEQAATLFPPASFELILCLGNTLPHLASPESLEGFLEDCARLLAPGGSLVLQLLNYRLAGPGHAFPEIVGAGLRFRRHYLSEEPGDGRIVFATEVIEADGTRHLDETRLLPIKPETLRAALGRAGFQSRDFAGWDESPFTDDRSPFLIVLARRP